MTDYGNLPTQPLPLGTRTPEAPRWKGVQPRSARGALARAGGQVALAGVVSRLTGFTRTIVLAALLGTAAVGDAYTGANNLPNMVYELLLGSVFASAVVPLLTRARRHGRKHSSTMA
ncbi:lipid II flippase MurJ [Nocardia sp. NPDC006044]|uniref:lipid II flippase MurJ n=1 Tax=Nocardia sp. NPDC006044 TaxID=3364306 RepID=UPI0036A8914F